MSKAVSKRDAASTRKKVVKHERKVQVVVAKKKGSRYENDSKRKRVE